MAESKRADDVGDGHVEKHPGVEGVILLLLKGCAEELRLVLDEVFDLAGADAELAKGLECEASEIPPIFTLGSNELS